MTSYAEEHRSDPKGEQHRVYQRAYYRRNREAAKAYAKAYRATDKAKARQRARYAERYRERSRADKLNRAFGITPDEFDRLLEAQAGKCAICGTSSPGGRWSRFSVDHDHETGRVRGLLCLRCNRALGLMDDDPRRLQRAANYLD